MDGHMLTPAPKYHGEWGRDNRGGLWKAHFDGTFRQALTWKPVRPWDLLERLDIWARTKLGARVTSLRYPVREAIQ